MTEPPSNPCRSPNPYIPASLSEIYDVLGSMMLDAPSFVPSWGPDRTVESEFAMLTDGFAAVRTKLGEENFQAVVALAAQARTLFAEDPADDNGKTREGIDRLYQIEGIIQSVRKRRVMTKAEDDTGKVTGD